MKRLAIAWVLLLVVELVAAGIPVAQAAPGGPKLVYNLNIIGKPSDYTGNGYDNGARHTIFIPLKTDYYTDPCSTTGGQNNPDTTQVPTKGVKLNIVGGSSFAVIDGDATGDKVATLQVITNTSTYYLYALAKGKPGGCLDLESYVWDSSTNPDTLVFLGSVDVDRKTGKPKVVNLTNLIYPSGVDLFADPYYGLFWQLYNNGLRLMNVRVYDAPLTQ